MQNLILFQPDSCLEKGKRLNMNIRKCDEVVAKAEEKAREEVNKKYSQDMLGYIHIFEKENKNGYI